MFKGIHVSRLHARYATWIDTLFIQILDRLILFSSRYIKLTLATSYPPHTIRVKLNQHNFTLKARYISDTNLFIKWTLQQKVAERKLTGILYKSKCNCRSRVYEGCCLVVRKRVCRKIHRHGRRSQHITPIVYVCVEPRDICVEPGDICVEPADVWKEPSDIRV